MIATIDINGEFIYFGMFIATAYEKSIKKALKLLAAVVITFALPVRLA